MKNAVFVAFLLWSFVIVGQTEAEPQETIEVEYTGEVLDRATGEPIPYVNIGIMEARIGTVSNAKGVFSLIVENPSKYEDKNLLISCLGYEPKEIPVNALAKVFDGFPRILLEPKVYELDEITVSNLDGDFINQRLGYRNSGEQIFGYWIGDTGLGAELATRIIARKGKRKLKTLEFEVWHITADSVQVRVNIYASNNKKGGIPGENLNTSQKNILYTITKDTKIGRVDLSDYNIFVENDFFVSLELLGMFGGDEIELILAGTLSRPGSFRKYVSMDRWQRLSYSMAYRVQTEYWAEGRALRRAERKVARLEKTNRYVSGFVLDMGRPLSNVKVSNTQSKEVTVTDENGKYRILAKTDDVLHYTRAGFTERYKRVEEKPTVNVSLVREAR